MSDQERIAALEKANAELKARLDALEPKPKAEFKSDWHGPIDWTANFSMPRSAIEAMVRAVPDNVVRDIVGDNLRSAPPPKPVEQRVVPSERGWQKEQPLESPPGVRICDQMMDVQDALDKRELAKRLGQKPGG